MNASLLPGIFEDEHIRVICWTLIHSLWIGLIAAVLAGAILVCAQKSSSHLRYHLLCGCLIIFVLITGFVFYQESGSFDRVNMVTSIPDRITLTVFSSSESAFVRRDIDVLVHLNAFINQNAGWIFTVWFLCFALKSLGLISGLFYVHRIRFYKVHQVSREWKERMGNYTQKLGIYQSISLLQSELVKVPVTVGHFKPVILIPIGLIFQLPAEQIETILIHELAHIKRRDYLVNLLQSLLETVFFFNPGLLWLSSLIKEERETCCDDIVLTNTTVKSNYLEALLAFHSQQPARSDLVLGLGSNQLVNRLKRIINHENKRLNKMEKIVLLAGLLIVSAFSYIPNPEPLLKAVASQKVKRHEVTQVVSQEHTSTKQEGFNGKERLTERSGNVGVAQDILEEIPVDTSWKFQSFRFFYTNEDPANRDMEVRDDKDNMYRVKIENGKVVSLKVNNAQIPESELGQYEKLLAEIDKSYYAARESKRASMERAHNYSRKEMEIRELKSKDWDRAKFSKDTDSAKSKFEKSGDFAYEKKKLEKGEGRDWNGKGGREVRKEFKIDKNRQKEFKKDKDNQKHPKFEKQKDKEWKEDKKFKKDKAFSKADFEQGSKTDQAVWAKEKGMDGKWEYKPSKSSPDVHRAARVKKMPEPADISADQERVRGVISELVQEKVISKPTDLEWFGLSEDELVVNGNKQPVELQQKLKEKFKIKADHGLYYGPVKMNGSGVFLDKGDL
ncbi:M56 family metallopeptidase [Dyadobacter endophyticus]|nr:M56 family metallopeptidase [Dyadobacter endophyticus]